MQVINATENQQCEKEIKKDSGLQCLITIAAYYGIPADVENIRHNFSLDDIIAGENDILRVAKKIKLKSRINKINRYSLPKMTLPAILVTNDSEFIIAAKADNDKVLIMFPFDNAPKIMTYDELESIWTGRIILFIPRSRTNQDIKFGFKWFIPSIIKYKKPLLEVILAAFIMQILSIFSPLITQSVIDKVLVHNSMSTLDVLSIGLIIILVFETILSIARNYVFTHTTSKIDVILSC